MTWIERGEKTTLVFGECLDRRWVESVVETWVWFAIDSWMSIFDGFFEEILCWIVVFKVKI